MANKSYCPGTQKLMDIFKATSENQFVRITDINGKTYEVQVDCWTTTTIGDDEDVDCLRFETREGKGVYLAGEEIESYEVIEDKK